MSGPHTPDQPVGRHDHRDGSRDGGDQQRGAAHVILAILAGLALAAGEYAAGWW